MTVADDLIAAHEPWFIRDVGSFEELLAKNEMVNPSFETDILHWNIAVTVTLSQWSPTPKLFGDYALRVVCPGALVNEGVRSDPMSISPGEPLSEAVYVWAPNGVPMRILLNWRDAGDVSISSATVTFTGNGSWQRVISQIGAGITPSNAALARMYVQTNTTVATTFYVDGAQFHRSPVLPPYFDGDSENAQWTGVPHASSSELYSPGDDLRDYLRTIGEMFSEVELYAFDTEDGVYEGWTLLLDVDRCPPEALPYLAQFVGERIPLGLVEAEQRQWIKDAPNQIRGTLPSIAGAAKRYLTGSKAVTIIQRDGGPDKLTVVTYTAETPNSGQVLDELNTTVPADITLTYIVSPGQIWSQVVATKATWTDVLSSYATWADVISGTPSGTY